MKTSVHKNLLDMFSPKIDYPSKQDTDAYSPLPKQTIANWICHIPQVSGELDLGCQPLPNKISIRKGFK